jgi:hypothetical protein
MEAKVKARVPWACPKCGAGAGAHGKGGSEKCVNRRGSSCAGLICECEDDATDGHGEFFDDPCKHANCYHCGWGGTVPKKPKGLQAWETKALEAGWAAPEARAKELAGNKP